MSDAPATTGAVVLEPDPNNPRHHNTGEQLPFTGLTGEVSNAYLSRQVADLRRLIETKFSRLDAIELRVDALERERTRVPWTALLLAVLVTMIVSVACSYFLFRS